MSDSESSSSKSNKSDDCNIIDKDDSNSSNKQRFSDVYQFFTLNESTNRWKCGYCK